MIFILVVNTDPRSSFSNGNDVLNRRFVASTQSENMRNSSNFQQDGKYFSFTLCQENSIVYTIV